MGGSWEDEVPLLVETSDGGQGYRKEGTIVYVPRRSALHQRVRVGMSSGMVKIATGLLLSIFLTFVFIASARYPPPATNSVRNSTPRVTRTPIVSKHRATNPRPLRPPAPMKPKAIPTPKLKRVRPTTTKAPQITIAKEQTRSFYFFHGQLGVWIGRRLQADHQARVTLDPISNSTAKCHDDHGPWFCEMVKTFGDSYYDNAGLNTTLHSGLVDIFGEEAQAQILASNRI
ncbi:hypothetical protein M3Y99_01601100 [Aphelenchoides fujianensis]|nr:hypothetical protein M3Y99_01601100 [Aphelenchoides fujianensis]